MNVGSGGGAAAAPAAGGAGAAAGGAAEEAPKEEEKEEGEFTCLRSSVHGRHTDIQSQRRKSQTRIWASGCSTKRRTNVQRTRRVEMAIGFERWDRTYFRLLPWLPINARCSGGRYPADECSLISSMSASPSHPSYCYT